MDERLKKMGMLRGTTKGNAFKGAVAGCTKEIGEEWKAEAML